MQYLRFIFLIDSEEKLYNWKCLILNFHTVSAIISATIQVNNLNKIHKNAISAANSVQYFLQIQEDFQGPALG